MRQILHVTAAALAFNSAVVAQQVILTVRTATVTQCFTASAILPNCVACAPTPTIHPALVPGGPIGIVIEAPKCDKCGFNDYTQTVKYTTEYDAFCSTGITRQKYECTEIYKGVPATPTILSVKVPFGFSEQVRTCYTCGPTPITATITQPVTGPQGTPYKGPIGNSGPLPGSSRGSGSGSGS
ncbi:hypothetical protein LY76DRAFT_476935, partial [Colletotrichum caudatum]